MKLKINFSKFYPIIIIAISIMISFIMIILRPEATPDEIKHSIPYVEVKNISPKTINMVIASQGTIEPYIESQIFSEIMGPVTYVSSKLYAGSSFKKGDILAKVDSKDYELNIKSAESILAAAKTKLSFEQAESKSALDEWNRIGKGNPSDLTLRIPQLRQAKSELEAAEANLERLKRDLNKTVIKAPYDGLVRKKFIDIGTIVAPGFLLASIYSIDYVEVRLPILDEELNFLDIPLDGSEIKFTRQSKLILSGTFGGKSVIWNGSIVSMEAEIDPTSRMAVLIGRVAEPYNLSKYEIPLRVGQFVEAEIIGNKYNNIYMIDRKYIKNKNQIILVNPADTTLQFQNINIIKYLDDQAYINSGLNRNNLICLTNLDVMYSGMKVQIK